MKLHFRKFLWIAISMVALSQSAMAGSGGPCGGTVNVPEPTSMAVLAAGIAGVLAIRRRLRKKP